MTISEGRHRLQRKIPRWGNAGIPWAKGLLWRLFAASPATGSKPTPPVETVRNGPVPPRCGACSPCAPPCCALADPAPFLHQEFLVLAVGLQVDGGDDVFADQDRQREIAEQALLLRHIGLEAVAVAEEQLGALALDDQRIERREDVHQAGVALARRRRSVRFQHLGPRPVLLLAGVLDRDRHQFLAPHPRLDQAPHRLLARRVEMADRIQADDALGTQRAIEQIGGDLRRRCRLRRSVPAEMPRHQLIGLEHAGAFGDRHLAGVEGKLQRPLRGFAALPRGVPSRSARRPRCRGW